MLLDVTTHPKRMCKKAQAIVSRTLVITIVVLVLIGVVSYIIYSKISGKLVFPG